MKTKTEITEILRLEKLTLGFNGNVVIKAADFSVMPGDFICVVGANGSGKSTLMKGTLGIIKPLSGEVVLKTGLEIGYLPQETNFEANFPATVQEVVLTGALRKLSSLRGFLNNEDDKRLMREKLRLMKIANLEKAKFSELSGGQKQKVLLVRALMATSELLVLDEPSNNLDHESREEFYRTLTDLNRRGLAIVMITHDLDADDLIGNKVTAIEKGRVATYETREYLERFK